MNDTQAQGRNLVICCDGTNNELASTLTNVVKLMRIAEKDRSQIVYYDPGVGTFGKNEAWNRFRGNYMRTIGNLMGRGLDDNVLEAYQFLVDTYRKGDRIFLFGFSRGAYTVRILAGMLHLIGLLWPNQKNLITYALAAYKNSTGGPENERISGGRFRRLTSARFVDVHFLGLWDTVASVFVPRSDFFVGLQMQPRLPFIDNNPGVKTVRHALAIDETRRMFRPLHWTGDPTDCQELWFSGAHADIGGGYPEATSGLSKLPLAWLLTQAARAGLRLNQQQFETIAVTGGITLHADQKGNERRGTFDYQPADPLGPQHDEFHGTLGPLWSLLEYLPKRVRLRESPPAIAGEKGLYLPEKEPRFIKAGAQLHWSVIARMQGKPDYQPCNIPEDHVVIGTSGVVDTPFPQAARTSTATPLTAAVPDSGS
jgi:uncharacterized protein (DUF2235 family)